MSDFRKLSDQVLASPQIDTAAIDEAVKQGVTLIVNNRPDGEEAGQPSGDEIRVAAEAAGLSYTAIPVTHAGFSWPQVEAMIAALSEASGPVLAYCRSGTRSCNLWALSAAGLGADADELTAKAAGAGYDLAALRPLMDAVAQRG